MQSSDISQGILQQADLCVKCGMCSNQCPTYLIKRDENESPRGRIALAQALATDSNKPTSTIKKHLDSCLSCLRCEKVCPSKVSFSKIMDNSKQLLSQNGTPAKAKLIAKIIKLNQTQWRRLAKTYRLASRSGLLFFGSLFFYRQFRDYLRPVAKSPENQSFKEQIQLFTGCLSHLFDQQTHYSLVSLLNACNVSVAIPKNQQCCGAIAKHSGMLKEADLCHTNNETAFDADKPILFSASGCGAHLKHQKNSKLNTSIEAGEFLLSHKNFSNLQFTNLDKKILVHSPCSEKNDLKRCSTTQLLSHIPGISITNIPDSTPCCGAAGSYMLKQPKLAGQIRELTEEEILRHQPDIIVTTNFPCAMHIAAGLKQKGLDIEVMHPLSLLQKQLNTR